MSKETIGEGVMAGGIERLLNLLWLPNTRDGETHMEWSAPCGCAYHPEPQPHVHQCHVHQQGEVLELSGQEKGIVLEDGNE